MLDKVKLEDIAFDVKMLGVDAVADKSGVMKSRVSRFIKNQQVVTMTELQKIKNAIQELKETK